MRNTFWISFGIALIITALIVVNFDKEQFMGMALQSGLLGNKAVISEMEFQNAFMEFVSTYKKSYKNSWEFESRYKVFKDNYQQINDHNLNADMIGFDLKINQFGDLTQKEFKDKYLTLTPPMRERRDPFKGFFGKNKKHNTFNRFDMEDEYSDLPKEVDWTKSGKVQKVKNQASCGSCWAFSAVGAMESSLAILNGTLPNLSEQQLVDCSGSYGNEGCNGGFMTYAFKYGQDHPMCTQTQYPYRGVDQTCKSDTTGMCQGGVQVKSFVEVKENSKKDFYAALAQQPLAIGVCAEGIGWQFYFSGIVRWLCGSCLDHGVLATGYGHGGWKIFGDTDFVSIKNSWGSSWGESGYIRVASKAETGKGTCGIYQLASYPKF